MGLAPYGEPRFVDVIKRELIDLKGDGSFRLNMKYFDYPAGLRMTSSAFDKLFGGPRREAETPITQREMDLAASIQEVTEEVMLRCARTLHKQTGSNNLCMAGGVALNCVGNGRILRDGPFENIWIQPAAGDSGGALGSALFIWHQLLENPRTPNAVDSQHGSLLGPKPNNEVTQKFLDSVGAKYQRFDDDGALCDRVAGLIADGNVVGWMQGRMEFGPRALGSRSILGDPRNTEMQSTMNLKIKFRESFRPFAPSVLRERVSDYFETRAEEDSPYMLLVAPVAENRRTAPIVDGAKGLDRVKQNRSDIPAVTHVDYSARIQTVDASRFPRYYKLIKAFEKATGCGVLINTSFNVRGEPIVCTAEEAHRCFMATDIDVLVVEDIMLLKTDQPKPSADAASYIQKFELD